MAASSNFVFALRGILIFANGLEQEALLELAQRIVVRLAAQVDDLIAPGELPAGIQRGVMQAERSGFGVALNIV